MKNLNLLKSQWPRFLMGISFALFIMAALPEHVAAAEPSAESQIQKLSDEMGSRYTRRPKPRLETEFTCTGDGNPVFTAHVKKCSGFCLRDHKEVQFTVEKGEEENSRRVYVTENSGSGSRCHAAMTFPLGASNRTAVRDLRFYDGNNQECDGEEGLIGQPLDGTFLNVRGRQFSGEVEFTYSQFAVVLTDSLDVLEDLDAQGRSCCTGQKLENCPRGLLKAFRDNPSLIPAATAESVR